MNAAELIEHVANEAGVDKKAARKALVAFINGIVEAVKKGEDVMLPGFGKFGMKDMPARTGRNPSTGEPIEIAASRRISFSPSKAVKDAISNKE